MKRHTEHRLRCWLCGHNLFCHIAPGTKTAGGCLVSADPNPEAVNPTVRDWASRGMNPCPCRQYVRPQVAA